MASVTIRTDITAASFDPGGGIPVILRAGTVVDTSQLNTIRQAAAKAGVGIELMATGAAQLPSPFPFDTRYQRATQFAYRPKGWDGGAQAALQAALSGTGVFRVWAHGDSLTAGQNSPNGAQADALIYGYVGRMEQSLAQFVGSVAAVGYTPEGCDPASLSAPSSPLAYAGAKTYMDGGIGSCVVPASAGGADITLTVPLHRVTGQAPTSVDLYTLDYANGNTWQWKVDGGAATTVTCTAGTGAMGGAVLRKTTVPLTGGTAHTVQLGTQTGTNALALAYFVFNYAATGVAIYRNGIQGWRACDFATGILASAAGAGFQGRASMTPDHVAPLAIPSSLGATHVLPGGDLVILAAILNDVQFGARRDAFRKIHERWVQASRRAVANASVLMLEMPYPSIYSDGTPGGRGYEMGTYKQIKQSVALSYGCGELDLDAAWGQTPVAGGLSLAGDIHPTANGSGAGGGDGHLLIAQSIVSLLTSGAS